MNFVVKLILAPLFLFACSNTWSAPTEPAIVDRGLHGRTWAAVRQASTPRGPVLRTNSYEEVSVGMHRWTEQGWAECDPKIEPFQDGAVVRGLQYSVIFAPNLASRGAIDLLLPDGNRLTGQILCLAYVDGPDSILIAETKDCAAVIGGPEQNLLTYQDAFTDFDIDVQFVVNRGSFSQELLLKQQLAGPRAYGLSDNAVLVLMTEWTDIPPAEKTSQNFQIGGENGPILQDEQIRLGAMSFARGHAFMADVENAGFIPVYNRLQVINGRTFLLEQVPWKQIQAEMDKLPAQRADAKPKNNKDAILHAKNQPTVPAARQKRPLLKPIQLGQAKLGTNGTQRADAGQPRPKYFVVDYDLVTTVGSLTWKSDTTYYISSSVTVTTNIFEGGCVIKYAPTNSASLTLAGPITCLSTNYRPIILTARDDHSVGEQIGSAALSGYYATKALSLNSTAAGNANDLRNFRISYASVGLDTSPGSGVLTLSHAQFVHCLRGMVPDGTTWYLRNALMYDVLTNFHAPNYSGTIRAEHVTIDKAKYLGMTNSSTSLTLCFTNSLLVSVTNTFTYTSESVGTDSDPANVFQTVGAASHYLITGSAHRNAGVTTINADLAAALKKKTTYPPVVIQNCHDPVSLTLYPQAQRDTDVPDRGFHYDPLDYAFGVTYLTNSTVTAMPGTAIGTFSTVAGTYGIAVGGNTTFVFEGTPLLPNHVVRYSTVQEQATANWGSYICPSVYTSIDGAEAPPLSIRFRFTDWSVLAQETAHLIPYTYISAMPPISLRDCVFYGGTIENYGASHAATNCLFERVSTVLLAFDSGTVGYRNCLFYRGKFDQFVYDTNNLVIKDTLFDQTDVVQGWDSVNDYNAYVTNKNRLTPNGAHDVILSSSPDYDSSPLGHYYLPTSLTALINTGSVTNAGLVGLYHYTSCTNQVKETNSIVNISYHYVASDSNGVPLDTDGDTLADVLEDLNGNGTADAGETDWQTYNSIYGIGSGPGLQVFTPLK